MPPDHYLKDALEQFRKLKDLADRAIAQVADADLFTRLGKESNSIALLIKHLAGNMQSRWKNFLTSDGEKPGRERDSEFVLETEDTKARLLERWEEGWRTLFDALAPLRSEDAGRTVFIRGQPHAVVEAVNRQLTHYAYHVGQMVFLAKHFAADRWRTLSVPRGKSREFNAEMQKRPPGLES
jgi:alkanesulfonate monooxygenase SsuD/methylene tetrahydromethanopterin reductase-like flavin-dependent oxidoreductase (luciferase family)